MKKIIALVLAALMIATVFAGCAPKENGGETTAPATDPVVTEGDNKETENNETEPAAGEKKTFTIAVPSTTVTKPAAEQWIWAEYEKMNNIHIDWVEIPGSAVGERKNLMMLGEEKPDAFWQIGFSIPEMANYGAQGAFVNLNDYPDAWPNLKKMLTEDVAGGLGAVTMPDGGIYSIPYVHINDIPSIACRMWLPKLWLENAKMEVPTNVDELGAFFEAVKTQDVNGNGDPDDEYPIYVAPGTLGWAFENLLAGAYGLGKNGKKPVDEWYVINDDGTLSFLYTHENWKLMWQQEAEWWAKGYYHPDTFNGYEYEQWTTDGTNGKVGAFVWAGPQYVYATAYPDYTYPLNLSSSVDDGNLAWVDYPVRNISMFTVTDHCSDPAALISWCDYFYSEEGYKFCTYGIEGETYTVDADGHIRYCDEIQNYEAGPQLGSYQYGLFTYGNFPAPGPNQVEQKYAFGEDEIAESEGAYNEAIKPYLPDFVPGMLATEDEGFELSGLMTDIDAYVAEARMNFITGVWNFDSDWDAYVEQMKNLGVEDFMAIRTTQYNRYLESVG